MLSGIGPAAQLLHYNIPVVLDAPSVGANLMDHPAFNLRLSQNTGISFNHLKPHNLRTARLFVRDVLRYQLWGTGPITSNVGRVLIALPQSVLNNGIDRRVCSIFPIRRSCALLTCGV
jgi:choline dehydrogenase-like flavoprotein